jgi:putative transposase
MEAVMLRLRAYKTKLTLNNTERTWCLQCAGAARWCYNYGLASMKDAYENGRKTSVMAEKKRLNAIKDEVAPWLRDVPYTVLQAAFDNLDSAYKNFFRRVKQGKTPGFPRFKSRKYPLQAFNVRDSVVIADTKIRLPRISWLRLAEHGYLPTRKGIRVLSATISTQDHGITWYVSAQVEEETAEPEPATQAPIGIDLGIKSLAVLSDGTTYENIKPLRSIERKIARLSREMARRKKGGSNWSKTKAKLNRAHAKARAIRQWYLHQISAETVAKRPAVIVMEDLNVSGMMANGHLSRAIADLGMYELRRQVTYKAAWNGSVVLLADRWEPSSKTCSGCGAIKPDLTLANREYVCPACGLIIDRDLNAALNLAALAPLQSA